MMDRNRNDAAGSFMYVTIGLGKEANWSKGVDN
jgi:hypothetical protein